MEMTSRRVFPIGKQPDGSGFYAEVWENGNVVWARELPGFDCANEEDEIPDDAPTLRDVPQPPDSWEVIDLTWQPPPSPEEAPYAPSSGVTRAQLEVRHELVA